nr:zinc finger, CCHC-type [Tanacetum cinerariifolium]
MQSEVLKFAAKSGGGSKRYRSSGSSSFNTESGKANVGDDEKDEVQEIRGPMDRDKAKDTAKKKGQRASGSSSMNDEALARLMVTHIANQEKEERLVFLEIKKREVECREREILVKKVWSVLSCELICFRPQQRHAESNGLHPLQILLSNVLAAHTRWVKVFKEIACLMLVSMTSKLQKNLEHFAAFDMLKELKTMFSQQAK